MSRITSGISQIGGKYRLLNTILEYIPYHEFYLEPFLGSAIVLLNKPRCRYECGNDFNSDLINYHLVASGWDRGLQEFTSDYKKVSTFTYDAQVVNMYEEMKRGVFGLVSQELCNRIVRGELVPRNNVERAYFFYYLNKLTFAGSVAKGTSGLIDNHNLSREGYGRVDSKVIKNAQEEYRYKTKGYAGQNQSRAIPQTTLHKEDFERIKEEYKEKKAHYSGMLNNFALGTLKEKQVEEAKANPNFGLINQSRCSQSGKGRVDKKEVKKAKKQYKQAQIKGINPKTTRPYTNNDCGLLSPLDPEAIRRLRYVNLTAYPFNKVYKMFYKAFYKRKGLTEECFIYIDPPYPGTEKYYGTGFGDADHSILIENLLECPFHWLLSIGGECESYLEALRDYIIIPTKVKYSTSANHQKDKQEYLIMNYNIEQLPLMQFSDSQNTLEEWF